MRTDISTKLERIDPTKAIHYLETMGAENRRVRQSHIDYLASQMKAGLWRITHQGIAFDKNGKMIDGQHRMWAVIESNTPIEIYVSRGVEPEDIAAVDSGLARDYVDVAHYKGWSDNEVAAPISKILALGITRVHIKIPPEVVHHWYGVYKEGVDFACNLRRECRPSVGKSMPVNVTAAFARAYYSVNRDVLLRMGAIMKTAQIEFEADRAALVLRDAWLAGRLGSTRSEQYMKTEAAIRAFVERRPIKHLQLPDSELFSIPRLPTDAKYAVVDSRKSPRTSKKARAQKLQPQE